MQRLAWEYTASYGRRANADARRDMATCRALMQNQICPAYAALQAKGVLSTLKRQYNAYVCVRDYADAKDPENPFASSR
jgi:hypothetical protein